MEHSSPLAIKTELNSPHSDPPAIINNSNNNSPNLSKKKERKTKSSPISHTYEGKKRKLTKPSVTTNYQLTPKIETPKIYSADKDGKEGSSNTHCSTPKISRIKDMTGQNNDLQVSLDESYMTPPTVTPTTVLISKSTAKTRSRGNTTTKSTSRGKRDKIQSENLSITGEEIDTFKVQSDRIFSQMKSAVTTANTNGNGTTVMMSEQHDSDSMTSLADSNISNEDESWGKFTKSLNTPSKIKVNNVAEIKNHKKINIKQEIFESKRAFNQDSVSDSSTSIRSNFNTSDATKGSNDYHSFDNTQSFINHEYETERENKDGAENDEYESSLEEPGKFETFDKPLYETYDEEIRIIHDRYDRETETEDLSNSSLSKYEKIEKFMELTEMNLEEWSFEGFQLINDYEKIIKKMISLRIEFSCGFKEILKKINRFAGKIEVEKDKLKSKSERLSNVLNEI